MEVWGQLSRSVRDEMIPLGVFIGERQESVPTLSCARSFHSSFTECSWGPVWYEEGLAALTAPTQAGLGHGMWLLWAS